MSSTGLNPAGDVIDRVAGGVWNASSFSIYKIPITYTFIDAHAMIMEGLIYDYNLAWEAPGKRRKNAFLSEAVQGLKLTDLLWSWESHLNNTHQKCFRSSTIFPRLLTMFSQVYFDPNGAAGRPRSDRVKSGTPKKTYLTVFDGI